tara:strand:+ start:411 stop:662 length:252 start_codon:yes stop_codon:yes gene_type:complete
MSDSVKKYYEMKEDGEFDNVEWARYIWVLDFERGKVYRYDIRSSWNHGEWNPDSEKCEDFLTEMGHSISNIEWMVCAESEVSY